MKKLFIFIIFITIVFTVINVSAMTYEDFIEAYPNEYIYRVNFPNGYVNYLSSPAELQFDLEPAPESGEFLIIKNPSRVAYYRLRADDGYVFTHEIEWFRIWAENPNKGFEGDIDIYIWSGYSFFLPLPSQIVGKLEGMTLRIMTIAVFGIVLLVVLMVLLKVLRI